MIFDGTILKNLGDLMAKYSPTSKTSVPVLPPEMRANIKSLIATRLGPALQAIGPELAVLESALGDPSHLGPIVVEVLGEIAAAFKVMSAAPVVPPAPAPAPAPEAPKTT